MGGPSMARQFDLKQQLKLHDLKLLQRLFAAHGLLLEFPWNQLNNGNRIYLFEQWEKIEEDKRRLIEIILQDVNELADEHGQRMLIDELSWRYPHRLDQFQQYKSLRDKALWVFLEAKPAFDDAAVFARAEALRNGQFANRWLGLPTQHIQVTDHVLENLQEALRSYYWTKELRGTACRVHHYKRGNDAEFFFAYLPDWPDKRLIFDDKGNLTSREEAYAFAIVFIYIPSDGALELIAKGGKAVHLALRKAFCNAVLGIEVADEEPVRPSYQLDHLIDPSFVFATEPQDRIATVRLRRIRLRPTVSNPSVEYLELKLPDTASHTQIINTVHQQLNALGIVREQVKVVQVGIQIQFLSDGQRAGKKMTFHISYPNSCDLKSKPDDVRAVGERCIKRWGITQ